MVALFVLGITGYIGVTVVEKLLAKYKDFETVALVRSEDRAKKVEAAFPQIRTVIGDLDSNETIAEESSKADIVLSAANCDYEGHIKSIYSGMAKHDGPTYLIHTSGTGILTDPTLSAVGEPFQTKYPIENRLVIETAPENAKQLIVCPPLIYGRGSGPDNQGSIQLPIYIEEVLQRKQAFAVGKGLGVWSNVHVQDLADLYLLLIEEALKEGGGKATWGKEGYYFAENGKNTWYDVQKEVARFAKEKGLIESSDIKHLTKEDVTKIHRIGPYLWGTNSKSKSSRAREQLGWKRSQPSIFETIEEEIDLTIVQDQLDIRYR